MSGDIEDIIRRVVDQALTRRPKPRVGIVTSYDPNRYAAKVQLQPEGHESGWIPIDTGHIGSGFGIAVGLTPGDQVSIGYHEDDPDSPKVTGRLHSDQERPPVAQSGEVVIQTSTSVLKIDKSGNITITSGGNMTISASGSIALTSGGQLTHNGHDIGSDHLHTNFAPGGGLSGPPQ